MVPETGIEPVRPLFTKAADFKSDVSTNFTTRAIYSILKLKSPPTSVAEAQDSRFANLIFDLSFWRRDPESNWAKRICNPFSPL